MTYCVAALVEEGIVFASDSRTSAGVDNIATFSKMNVCEVPGERVIVVLSSGNLATTQSVIARLQDAREGRATAQPRPTASWAWRRCSRWRSSSARRCAKWSARQRRCAAGRGHRLQLHRRRPDRPQDGRGSSASIPRATSSRRRSDTNFFQIGEHKYGKPIIDRVVKYHDAAQGRWRRRSSCRSIRRCART